MIWHSVNLIKSKDNKDYFYKIIKLNMQTFNSYSRIALWVCTNIYDVSFIYYIIRLNYYNKRRRTAGLAHQESGGENKKRRREEENGKKEEDW